MLGEHLIAMLVVAILVIGAATSAPALIARTKQTAAPAQERVNMPLAVAAQLESTP